jgi:preprotein translocase subunit SecG
MTHIRRPMDILSILLTVIIVAVSILIVLIVLVQRPKQEGLGAAFGGSTLDSALGAHTTDVLQKITTWLGIIFFVSAIVLAMVKTRQFRSSAAQDVLEKVENREPQLPGLPPELSNLPDLSTPATSGETPAAPAGDDSAPKGKAPESTPEGKAKEAAKEAPKAGEKAKAPASKEAPKAKGKAGE